MSTIRFNDDISLSIPYGWGSETVREEGKTALRIAGPGAGAYLSSGTEYECDFTLSVSKEVDGPLEKLNFSEKLKEVSDKAPDIQISVSVSSSFGSSHSNTVGGSGFQRERRAVLDRPDLKTGYFTMGILGKTASIGVIITDRYLYMCTPLKSKNLESSRRYLPDILKGVELLHAPLSPQEKEKQRKEREAAEEEKRKREEAERRKKEEEAQAKKRKTEKKKAEYEKAVADFNQKKKEVEDQRLTELAAAFAERRKELKAQAKNRYAEELDSAEKLLKECEEAKHQAEEMLQTLGAFRFGEKKEQRRRLAAAEDRILDAGKRIETGEKNYREALATIETTIRAEESRMRAEIERRLPLPKRPVKTAYLSYQNRYDQPAADGRAAYKPTAQQVQNEAFKESILEWMEADRTYTVEEIQKGVPFIYASGISAGRVSGVLESLVNDQWLEKQTAGGSVRYCLM